MADTLEQLRQLGQTTVADREKTATATPVPIVPGIKLQQATIKPPKSTGGGGPTISYKQAKEAITSTPGARPGIFKRASTFATADQSAKANLFKVQTPANATEWLSKQANNAGTQPTVVQQAGNAGKGAVVGALEVLNKLGQYANAGLALAVGAPTAAIQASVDGTLKGSWVDRFKQSFASAKSIADQELEGKGLYEIAGVNKKVKDYLHIDENSGGIKNLAVDLPLALLGDVTTFGGSAVAAKAYTTGNKVLNLSSEGKNIFNGIVKDFIEEAGQTEKTISTADRAAFRTQAADIIKNQILNGKKYLGAERGLAVAGKTILPTGKVIDGAASVIHNLATKINELVPGIKSSTSLLREAFIPVLDQLGKDAPEVARVLDMAESDAKYAKTQVAEFIKGFGKITDRAFATVGNKYKSVEEALAAVTQRARQVVEGPLTDDELYIIATGRGTDAINALRPEAQEAANTFYRMLDDAYEKEQAVKLSYENTKNYFPTTYKESGKQITQKINSKMNDLLIKESDGTLTAIEKQALDSVLAYAGKNKSIQYDMLPFFAKDRIFANPEEARVFGLTPENPLNSLYKRLSTSANAVHSQGAINTLMEKFGDKLDDTIRYSQQDKSGLNLVKYTDKATGESRELPEYLSAALTKYRDASPILDDLAPGMTTAAKGTGVGARALQTYDKLTDSFKAAVTLLFPKYYTRNLATGVFNNLAGMGALAALNPKNMGLAAALSSETFLKRFGNQVVKLHGTEYTLNELRQLLERTRTIQTGAAAEGLRGALKKGVDKLYAGFPDASESYVRNLPFIHMLNETGDVTEAARFSKLLQVDYDKLTPFEKNVMRRVFPFYTFTRRNINSTLEYVKQNPAFLFQMQNVRDGVTQQYAGDSDQAGAAPDYVKRGFSTYLGKDAEGMDKYLGELGLGIEDINQLIPTSMDAFSSRYGGSLNPLLKAPLEMAFKFSTFTGQEIRPEDAKNQIVALRALNAAGLPVGFQESYKILPNGQKKYYYRANPVFIALVQNLPTARLTNVISKLPAFNKNQDDQDTSDFTTDFFTGLKYYKIDPEIEGYYKGKQQGQDLLKAYQEMGLVKQKKNGQYYVDYNEMFVPGDDQADAQLKLDAAMALLKVKTIKYPN